MVHLRLLGPMEVVDDDGNDLTPAGARERLCLATLAVDAPNSLSNERLAAELYRGRDTADPRNAVQAVVSRLRRALGRHAHVVETTAGGYRLVEITIDIDDAQTHLAAAAAAAGADEARAHLGAAEQLRRGGTLEGLEGDLVDAERLRFDNLLADATDAVARRRLDEGDDPELIGELEAALGRDPGREQRWELLMLALYRQGRQADALRAFQRARRHLADELGLEPGPGLVDLEQRILRHDASLAGPTGVGGSPGPGGNTDPEPTGSGELPAGTVTVLMCDVVGSVRRWEREPIDTEADVAELHRVWAAATEEHGGYLVKSTGDGVLAVFTTAGAALGAGVEALGRPTGQLSVRAAAFTGTAQPTGADYRGPVVNRCARLLELGHGGQFLVPATTAGLAQGDLPPEIDVRSLGHHRLRDVAAPFELLQVGGPGLAADFPPLDTPGSIRLPRLRTTLVGRDAQVAEIVERMTDHRLVTLLGPGGVGKTSLALAAAWRLAELRSVVFVDLAQLKDPEAVVEQMLDELPLPEHTAGLAPLDRLIDRLATNGDLLVVDNAEHLLDAVAEVADAVLDGDGKGALLVTSRQPLGLNDEELIAVPPLALPGSDDDLDVARRSPSIQLFVERVRAVTGNREIPPGLLPVVGHICRRLDGLPLAIELAAGRASVLSIEDIAARLDDQLRLLRQLQSSRERRHRSLEAVVGWSADQLSPPARELFNRLSVMAGSFNAAGAEGLAAACDLSVDDVLDSLDELVAASLVVSDDGGPRLRMLEPIRQFAAAELADRGREEETRRAHARWITEVVANAHRRRDEGKAAAMAAVDEQSQQLLAALDWLASAEELDLAVELAFMSSFWFLSRDARVGERLFERLLLLADRTTQTSAWAHLVLAQAVTTAAHPRSSVADVVLDALAVFDAEGHPDTGVARVAAAFNLAGASVDPAVPLRLLDEADRLISSDDRWSQALADLGTMSLHGLLANIGHDVADPDQAVLRGERAIAALKDLGEHWVLGVTLGELGRLHQTTGDLERAEQRFVEALELLTGSDYHGRHYILTELGRMSTTRGRHDQAARYHEQAMEIAEEYAHPGCVAMALAGQAHAADGRGDGWQAIDLYRSALELAGHASLIEHGMAEWTAALARLEAEHGASTGGGGGALPPDGD
ncbi:MAG: BTAD domain-containing putative transcriptional regulator [Actinomycetota bacterium]